MFADASVRGDFWAPKRRRQVGRACAGWIAWNSDELEHEPLFAGAAFLGSDLGPQKAEYLALVSGLQDARAWLATRSASALEFIAHTDNRCVAEQMNGHRAVSECAVHFSLAQSGLAEVGSYVASAEVIKVARTHPGLKRAHSLAARAWETVVPPNLRPQTAFTSSTRGTATAAMPPASPARSGSSDAAIRKVSYPDRSASASPTPRDPRPSSDNSSPQP